MKFDESLFVPRAGARPRAEQSGRLTILANTMKRLGHGGGGREALERRAPAEAGVCRGVQQPCESHARPGRIRPRGNRWRDARSNSVRGSPTPTSTSQRSTLRGIAIPTRPTLDALLAFAPTHPRALAARALALKELDRLDEALDTARRAALAAPESPEPHNAIGQILQAMGQFEPALAAYDRAVALAGPAQQDAAANRGGLFVEFGRKAEAAGALEEAAKAFPNAPGILLAQTELNRSSQAIR